MRVFDLLKSRIDKMEEERDVNGLVLALKDDDEVIRRESVLALGNIASSEALEPLIQALHDQDKGVKEEAITALGKIGDPQATKPLINELNSQYISIRWRAAQALGKIGDPQAIEPLTQTLQDLDKGVKEEAITALGRITVNPYLKDLKSNQSEVKKAIHDIGQSDNLKLIKDQTQIRPAVDIKVASNSEDEDIKEIEIVSGEEKFENVSDTDLDEYKIILKKKGYYNYIERFVAKSRYDYQEDMVRKVGYNYQSSDLEKLHRLLELKGIGLKYELLEKIIQGEIKAQEFYDFEEKIMKSKPINKQKYLEIYIKNHSTDTPRNLEYLKILLEKQDISTKNLENEIIKLRREKEIREFENKLLKTSMGDTRGNKGSPSILLKFMKKELVEKRDKLVSTGNYGIIENFVRLSKYNYHIKDFLNLKKLLKSKNIALQDEELFWIIRKEIEIQEYREFEEKIMEANPTTKRQYLEQFINIYPDKTNENIKNLHKLLQKQNLTAINLEKEIKEMHQEKEISKFEERLADKQDWVYKSIPVIESKVTKDKALKNAQILSNLGNLFYDLGKNDDALIYYDKSISTYPDYIGAWKNKGLIFYTMDRPQKALNCFYHVLNLDSGYGEVWLDIGVILFEMGRFREAKQCYEKAVQMQPENLDELSSYTRQFLYKNSYYQDIFNEFLKYMSSDEFTEDITDSDSAISQIMQFLNED